MRRRQDNPRVPIIPAAAGSLRRRFRYRLASADQRLTTVLGIPVVARSYRPRADVISGVSRAIEYDRRLVQRIYHAFLTRAERPEWIIR